VDWAMPSVCFDFRQSRLFGCHPAASPSAPLDLESPRPIFPVPSPPLRQSWVHRPRIECNSRPANGGRPRWPGWRFLAAGPAPASSAPGHLGTRQSSCFVLNVAPSLPAPPRSHDGASALPVVLSHLPVYPLNCLTMGRFLTSSTLALLAAAGVQAADVALYGQCGGIGYTGPTTCVAGSFCMHYNDWYCECYPPRELAP